ERGGGTTDGGGRGGKEHGGAGVYAGSCRMDLRAGARRRRDGERGGLAGKGDPGCVGTLPEAAGGREALQLGARPDGPLLRLDRRGRPRARAGTRPRGARRPSPREEPP